MDEIYSVLSKKHGLPDFRLMDAEFEISSIEEESFPLRNIRKKITEKIDFSVKLLDEVLHPDSGLSSYHEASIFDKSEQERLLKLYRELMYYARLSTELAFADSDNANADFIKQFMKDWPKLKESILVFVRKMKDSWKNDVLKKEVVRYLG